DPADETGHGTHVAGTIGAVGNNSIGVTGVSLNVSIAALKIGTSFFTASAAIKAFHYANQNNIPIVNCSWGTRAYCPCQRYAISNYNGLVIASAGNDGTNNDIYPIFPASFECDNIISVASSTINDELSLFSNYGAVSVGIAAPGSGIFSTAISGGYTYMDGTSMSAPHVAGAAALLKSYRPELSPLKMKEIIYSSVDKNPRFYGKILTGGSLNIGKMIELASEIAPCYDMPTASSFTA
ncbi:MAG: S8 family serine peptidase, partial [Oscillospiraceae bacterium]|nr:S8 family serine peptidase [Oscillospiraceae bacterium]